MLDTKAAQEWRHVIDQTEEVWQAIINDDAPLLITNAGALCGVWDAESTYYCVLPTDPNDKRLMFSEFLIVEDLGAVWVAFLDAIQSEVWDGSNESYVWAYWRGRITMVWSFRCREQSIGISETILPMKIEYHDDGYFWQACERHERDNPQGHDTTRQR